MTSNAPIQLIMAIDYKVRATLYRLYKNDIESIYMDTVSFKSDRAQRRFVEDYQELTRLYIAKFNNRTKLTKEGD